MTLLFRLLEWPFFSILILKVKTMTPVQAVNLIGGLSKPSKMPCKGYSIPAWRCITGAKMREVKGSICAVCYALKGNYLWSNVKNALKRAVTFAFTIRGTFNRSSISKTFARLLTACRKLNFGFQLGNMLLLGLI